MLVELSVMEQRYQAVLAIVQDGWKVTEVAQRLDVSRQTIHSWLVRTGDSIIEGFEQGGLIPTITGFHHLSLSVRDAEKSAAFYSGVFQFVPVLRLPDTEGRGFKKVMAHPESRTILGFSVHQTNDGSEFSEFRTGIGHLSFGVASRAELDAWIKRLDELSIEQSEVSSSPVGHLITVRDPDNVQVELWADPA